MRTPDEGIVFLNLDEHLGRDVDETALAGLMLYADHSYPLPFFLQSVIKFKQFGFDLFIKGLPAFHLSLPGHIAFDHSLLHLLSLPFNFFQSGHYLFFPF